jgi:PDZ domain
MPASAFSTPRPAMLTSLGPGRLRLRNGKFLQYDNSPARSETRWKLSEMINPDGSVTVRRKVVNPDGYRSIIQEEYASMDQRILGKYDLLRYEESSEEDPPSIGLRSSSSASSYSTPSVSRDRSFESHDQSSEGSTFSVHWNKPLKNEDMEASRVWGRTQHNLSSQKRTQHTLASHKSALRSLVDDRPWNFNDADLSAISGDSVGDPLAGSNLKIQVIRDGEQNDDASSEWSLLYDGTNDQEKKSLTGNMGTLNPLGKPPLPQKGNICRIASREPVPTRATEQTSPPSLVSGKKDYLPSDDVPSWEEEESQLDLPTAVLKQADTLAKPQVKYYSDPGIRTPSRPLGPGALRTSDALLDEPSLHSNQNDCSTESSSTISTNKITYTVRKSAPDDQVGIFVAVRDAGAGPQLVVSRVKPGGKFAESPIERGDIVVSINGVNFLRYPNAHEALGKTEAFGVTLVIHRACSLILFLL